MPSTTATTVAAWPKAIQNGLCALPPDIITSHVLTRLDGLDLVSAACCSAALRHLSSDDELLWARVCRSTWPSTASPLLNNIIQAFPGGGARAFFSHAYPTPADQCHLLIRAPSPSKLISAIDIRCEGKLIFSKALETETVSGWFRCSPFRVDLLEPKDMVSTAIKHPDGKGACGAMIEGMSLSWIVVDPIGRRAVNLSSHRPVAVQSHWLTGEVQVRYASILRADHHRGHVQCGMVITCGESESGEMQVREVSMEMEDMDGVHLNGKDSLVFLQVALEGRKGAGKNRVQEGERRYKEYVEMKRERRERKLRRERALDVLCVAFGVFIFLSFCCFLWCR